MQKPVHIIFDSNAICHAVKWGVDPETMLISRSGVSTGIIYGFIKKILPVAETISPDIISFAWDSKSSKRKDMYPEYKANRNVNKDKTEEELAFDRDAYEQFDMLREDVLPKLGFTNVYCEEGYEADDIMAYLADVCDHVVVLVTNDGDMLQTLSSNCSIYHSTGKKHYTTIGGFVEKWGIEPKLWGMVKAIAGCSTDNVAGVPGVGDKTAVKFIKGELKPESKKYKDIVDSAEIIDRNIDLVVLPMTEFDIDVDEERHASRHNFIKVCEEFDFTSLISNSMLSRWERAFGYGPRKEEHSSINRK